MRFKEVVRAKVLPVLNSAIGWTGLKVSPSSTPNRDFAAFMAHLKRLGMAPASVIDVGVHDGTHALYTGAVPHLVEPVPAKREKIEALALQYGGYAYNVAAGAEDGEVTLNVHDISSGSSVLSQWEGQHMDGEPITVPMKRLDTLLAGKLSRPCLLKIDTQGYELEVMAGASGILDQIDVVILEVSFHQFRKGAPEFNEIVARMETLGFACYETLEGHYRSLDNAMAQVDLAFAPKDSALRRERGYFSPAQARLYLSI